MPEILIANLNGRRLWFGGHSASLLFHIQQHGLDWMHACGGKGRCTTCKVIVLRGADNLGPRSLHENRYYDKGELRPGERLACQAVPRGDVEIAVPPEGQLPHISYSPY